MALAAVACAIGGAAAGPASARPRPPAGDFPATATSAGVAVHYTTATGDPDAVTPEVAQRLADQAAGALAALTGPQIGWPAAIDDGDGVLDIYIWANLAEGAAQARPDSDDPLATTSAFVVVHPARARRDAGALFKAMSHEITHVSQMAVTRHLPAWVDEATADWTQEVLAPGPYRSLLYLQHLDAPLNCFRASCGARPNELAAGYARWVFFEFLAQVHGSTVVPDVYRRAASLEPARQQAGLDAIELALAPRGSSLARAFNEFSAHVLTSRWRIAAMRRFRPTPSARVAALGHAGRRTATARVDHLAARVVEIRGGRLACAPGRLHVTARIPPGTGAAPAVVTQPEGKPVSLRVSGLRGKASLGFSSCAAALLSLPNPSATLDDRRFTIATRFVAAPARLRLTGVPAAARASGARPAIPIEVVAKAPGTAAVSALAPRRRGERRRKGSVVRFRRGRQTLRIRLPAPVVAGIHRIVLRPRNLLGQHAPAVRRDVRVQR